MCHPKICIVQLLYYFKLLYIKPEYLLKTELFGLTYGIVGLKMSTNEW